MIDVKTAVRIAHKYLTELYPDDPEVADVRLEEVELGDDNKWHVTLSFLSAPFAERTYKQFEIMADDGAVRSMKIRSLR